MLVALKFTFQLTTFGFGGKDILDENYRKAKKLDAAAFSTNFHPHDCGFMESIQQILLPRIIAGGQLIGIGPKRVRTELYNLNICSRSFLLQWLSLLYLRTHSPPKI